MTSANISLLGVNLSGGEYGNTSGTYGWNYIYPSTQEIDYYSQKGVDVIRVPFLWERVQPELNGSLNAAELLRLDAVVDYATSKGIKVILDPHDYGAYNGQLIGSSAVPDSAFADFWGKLAAHYKDDPQVMFGLMNEPNQQSATSWLASENAAIAAIRSAGATQEILVQGSHWDGAWTWTSTDNAAVIGTGIVDPLNNYAFEVHQYLDTWSSGTDANVVSTTVGVERLAAITAWAEQNHARLFLGEFGVGQDATSLTAMDNMLGYLSQHADVWQGATYWAGGPWWGDYMYSIEPNADGSDKPQMDVLERFISPPAATTTSAITDPAAGGNGGNTSSYWATGASGSHAVEYGPDADQTGGSALADGAPVSSGGSDSLRATAGPTVHSDFNGDGKSDILLQNVGSGDSYIWELDGTQLVGAGPVGWTPGANWHEKGIGDFNGDGKSDILLQNAKTGDCFIWEMNGTQLIGGGYVGWTPGANWEAAATGDFNGDGRSDILLQNTSTGDSYIWELDGTQLVGSGPVGWTPGAIWEAKGTGDFNGDSKSDVLLQNANTGDSYIWELDGTQLVGSGPVGWTPGAIWEAKGTGDFNGDGKSDILLQNANTGDSYVWELDGTQLVGSGPVGWTPGAIWEAKGTGDFNGDGKSDILLQNANTGDSYIWELNGTQLVGGGFVGWTPGPIWIAHS